MAYRDLVSCRPPEGPIPWDKVALYADRKGLEPDNADLLWAVIRKMDLAERSWITENTLPATPPDQPGANEET